MRIVFIRLLKTLWFLVLALVICTIPAVVIESTQDINYGDWIENNVIIFICSVPILIIMQYILLGSFNPKRLFDREERYPR